MSKCPDCGARFRVAANALTFECPSCGCELAKRGHGETKGGGHGWVVALVLGLTLPLLLCVGIFTFATSGSARTNARCPICGQEFNIPVHHGIGQFNQFYHCPNCGIQSPASDLYKRKAP